LKPFIEPQTPRESWLQSVSALPGLDGIDAQSDVSAGYSDPAVTKEYQEFERRRAYQLDNKRTR
jgi:cell filamentation protein